MKKRTPDYWSGRFKQLEEAQHDKSLKKMQEIEQQFRRSEQVIQGKINAWYQRFADNNGISMKEAKRLLNSEELEEFHWDVQDYIRYGKNNAVTGQWMQQLENASAKVHISRLEALKLQCQQEAEALYGNYLDSIDQHITDIYKSQYYHTVYEIQKGTGIGQHFQSLNQTLVENIIQKPWAVDGRNFSERIWTDKTKLINTLHNSLTRMCITGEAPDQAIREVKKRMKTSQEQAARLVQTEAAAFAAKAQQDCYKELDVEEFEVLETLDEFTCPTCGDMDEKHFPMSEYVVGVTAPPFHPNCRGCTCPYFDDEWATSGKRVARRKEDGKEYYVPENMTYKEWKETYLDKEPGQEEKSIESKPEKSIMNLSHEEASVLEQYKSFDSYKINDVLRNAKSISELSKADQRFVELMDSALSKIPRYSGDLVRTINFSAWPDSAARVEKFISEYIPEKIIKISQYWSTSNKNGYDDEAEILIYIENAKNGRDIRLVGLNENEILYERDSKFKVISKAFVDGKWNILLEEAE